MAVVVVVVGRATGVSDNASSVRSVGVAVVVLDVESSATTSGVMSIAAAAAASSDSDCVFLHGVCCCCCFSSIDCVCVAIGAGGDDCRLASWPPCGGEAIGE